MPLFELRSPRDMLLKAKREYAHLSAHLHIDNVFNFFVTAYHIQDYALKTKLIPQAELEQFLKDSDLRDCRDLCDKGKHLTLTKRADPLTSSMSGCIGGAPIAALPIASGEVWLLHAEDRTIDVLDLATRVIEKWEALLGQYEE